MNFSQNLHENSVHCTSFWSFQFLYGILFILWFFFFSVDSVRRSVLPHCNLLLDWCSCCYFPTRLMLAYYFYYVWGEIPKRDFDRYVEVCVDLILVLSSLLWFQGLLIHFQSGLNFSRLTLPYFYPFGVCFSVISLSFYFFNFPMLTFP